MIIGLTADGRKIVVDVSATVTVPIGGGDQGIVITFKELKKADKVWISSVTTDPPTSVSLPQNIDYDGNVVGMTLTVAAGTTLTVEGIAIGW